MIKEFIRRRFVLLFGIITSVNTILFRFGYIYDFDVSKLDFDFLLSSFAAVIAGFLSGYLISRYVFKFNQK